MEVVMSMDTIGRYEIVSTLGKGAMGVVYLARDPLIDRQVALKTLRVDLDADYTSEFRERFLREAKAAGRLNHPGIVTIHDVGEDPESGLVFIAMEFIEGRDLKQLLSAGHEFRPSEAARITADVAKALDYAHSMGVVHRDIKPANIILTSDGTAKITDFGIAHLESSNLTVDGQFIGTPNFMSPEQITGKPVDGRSDIFSLGVVLFTLLTGQRPFAGETMHEVTMKVVGEPCPVPSTLAPQIPPGINPIILKCLEKEPDNRFQSGAELAQVLAALGRSLTERKPGDAASTGVVRPDLDTRLHALAAVDVPEPLESEPEAEEPRRMTALRDFTSPRRPGQRPLRDAIYDRLKIPEILKLEVNPLWVTIILTVWSGLWFGAIGYLALNRVGGPFHAPSDGAVHNRHHAAQRLFEADRLLRRGDLESAASAAADAVDQVPSSKVARDLLREINRRLQENRTTAEIRSQVADLVAEGRDAYRKGRYRTAAERFQTALDLDPENELVSGYLDLATERQRAAASRSSSPRTSRPQKTAADTPQTILPTPKPTPGTARITVSFNSPISRGDITVTRNDAVLDNIPFDFSKKNVLGIKRRGTGAVKRVLLTPSGRQTIGVQLREERRGLVGARSFQVMLSPGSDWTLRIDLPAADADANFFLVEKSR
jgi:serine/threonine protein kinase